MAPWRKDEHLLHQIATLLADPQHDGHPMKTALSLLYQRFLEETSQIERLTELADAYQAAQLEASEEASERYRRQVSRLQKVIRISDQYQQAMRAENATLAVTAACDALTELPNRRFMSERLAAESARALRFDKPFSLALVDVDNFKGINDRHGHGVGDAALLQTARSLCAALRAYDICGRWGGDEFLVIMPETPGPDALGIALRLCQSVSSPQESELPRSIRLSVSVGVAECGPHSAPEEALAEADRALYQAKAAGRNQAILAG
ncbi:MAG TPA: diguanylate cyclase [Armatimonadota bacterium]